MARRRQPGRQAGIHTGGGGRANPLGTQERDTSQHQKTFLCLPCPHPSVHPSIHPFIHSPGRHPFAQPPSHHATHTHDRHPWPPSIHLISSLLFEQPISLHSSIHSIAWQGVRKGTQRSIEAGRPAGRQAGQEKYPWSEGLLGVARLLFGVNQSTKSISQEAAEGEGERAMVLSLSIC